MVISLWSYYDWCDEISSFIDSLDFFNSNRVWNSWFTEITGLALLSPVVTLLIKMGEVLVSLTPGEIVGAGLTWLVWPGMPGSRRTSVHPQITSMVVPTIKTCARGCFVRLRWLLGVPGDHPRPLGAVERVDSVSFDGVSVGNCRWTACPFGGWNVRSNNARTVVSKLLDWMFGIIPVDWNRVKSSQPTGFASVVLYFEHLVHLIRGPRVVFWCLLHTRRSGLHHTKKRWTHP